MGADAIALDTNATLLKPCFVVVVVFFLFFFDDAVEVLLVSIVVIHFQTTPVLSFPFTSELPYIYCFISF